MSRLNVKRVYRILSRLLNGINNNISVARDMLIGSSVVDIFSSSQSVTVIDFRRDVNLDFASIESVLHDITAVVMKKSQGHTEKAERFLLGMVEKLNDSKRETGIKITSYEADIIIKAILSYASKEVNSNNISIELLKDFDAVDRYLYGVKSQGAYLERCKNVLKDMRIEKAI